MPDAACVFCEGGGDHVNLGNLNPYRKIEDWLAPVLCGRCGGSGIDPDGAPEQRQMAPGNVVWAPKPRNHLRSVS